MPRITRRSIWHNYRPPTKLREGNVFTGVCHSAHGGGNGELYPRDHASSLGLYPPPTNHKSRRYASYWNAFLFSMLIFFDKCPPGEVDITRLPCLSVWTDPGVGREDEAGRDGFVAEIRGCGRKGRRRKKRTAWELERSDRSYYVAPFVNTMNSLPQFPWAVSANSSCTI